MASHCLDTGPNIDVAETKNLSHANNWAAGLFKEAWISNKKTTYHRLAAG